jgi:2-oxo-3-(phosphooxy)propyl 3-oxoalkanoate synthase
MRNPTYRYFLICMDSADGLLRPPGAEHEALSRSRTVDHELVHRVSVAEVLLTDVRRTGPDRFAAAASWPRSHPTFPRGTDDRHSPLVLVETVRQLGIYIPLRYYGVDPAAHFLIRDVSFTLDPRCEPRADWGASEITCQVSVGELRAGRDGVPRGMRMWLTFRTGEASFGRAEGSSRFVAAEGYAALRARTAREAAPADRPARPEHLVLGVGSPGDVVIGLADDAVAFQPADARHPFLFDHASDHVPGMALLEAARQATAWHSRGRLSRPFAGQLKALRFTEHAPPARVECAVYARTSVFRFRQGGSHSAIGVLRYH